MSEARRTPPEAIFFSLVAQRASALGIDKPPRQPQPGQRSVQTQYPASERRATDVSAIDAQLAARRDEYHELVTTQLRKLDQLRRLTRRGFFPQEEFTPIEQQVSAFAALQGEAPVLRQVPEEVTAVPHPPAARTDARVGARDLPAERPDRTRHERRKGKQLVRFTFPGEEEATEVHPRAGALLETFRRFMESDGPPHLISVKEIMSANPALFTEASLLVDISSIRRLLKDHQYRLGQVEGEDFENTKFFVEKSPKQTATARVIGEHIITDTVRYGLYESEYSLLYRLRNGIPIDAVSEEDVGNLNYLLAEATGVQDSIVLRESDQGDSFYDLTAIGVTRHFNYLPITSHERLALGAFFESPETNIATGDIALDTRGFNELADTVIRLFNRGNAGIAIETAAEDEISEAVFYEQLLMHIQAYDLNPEALLGQIARRFGVQRKKHTLNRMLRHVDSNPRKTREYIDNAPLPQVDQDQPVVVDLDVGTEVSVVQPTAATVPTEPVQKGRRKAELLATYSIEELEREAEVLLGGLRLSNDFNFGDRWEIEYIATRIPDKDITIEALNQLLEDGKIVPIESTNTVELLDEVTIVEAIMLIKHKDMPEERRSELYGIIKRKVRDVEDIYPRRKRRIR